jgi:hypothetical protein
MTAQPRRLVRMWSDVPRRRLRTLAIVATIVVVTSVAVAAVGLSLAFFTAQAQPSAVFGTKAVFPGERVTPAFHVGDSSSGAEVDSSSAFVASADGLTTTTSSWSTAFAPDRYMEFDFNDSLASGVAISTATFDFTFASGGSGQACYYFEVRTLSSGAVLGTYGSPASPAGCVNGPTLTALSTLVPDVATTSVANDLRVRVFGRESGGAPMVIDLATVGGATSYQTFNLYPVMFRDAADASPRIVPWGLQIP